LNASGWLAFVATVTNRWFVNRKGLVTGVAAVMGYLIQRRPTPTVSFATAVEPAAAHTIG
jgi:hypothetical protein